MKTCLSYRHCVRVAGFNEAFWEKRPPARSSGALFDEMLDIANTPMVGQTTKADKDGNFVEVTTGE
ncbi:Hypothetical protein NGAL_HAMBI1189_56440 [Neorhizobium galegae bv. officinalis]|uniref:Uncharacterized protein n=1 Tax=Neorhizobium galegae bv. officinalis TaxID=323656 RepID=A0A0T7H5B7_NEOGA|nr:Hypothetical protein NGAL_HAMBI1189_56440 [Neorhizobium galegae bv. officinalis]